jgi:hypothetical protein
MSEEKKITSRRDFFERLALFGAGTVAGAGVVYTGYRYEKSKDPTGKVRVLTADNKVVEVEASALRPVLTEEAALQVQ